MSSGDQDLIPGLVSMMHLTPIASILRSLTAQCQTHTLLLQSRCKYECLHRGRRPKYLPVVRLEISPMKNFPWLATL